MRAMIMRREFDPCWGLVPYFCKRIENFDARYQIDHGYSGISDLFKQAFASGDSSMLGIALFEMTDSGPLLAGHLVAGVDLHHGRPMAVIYQYEKDESIRNNRSLDDEVQSLVDNWVLSRGLNEVSALAISPGRMRHFKRWSYGYSATLITRRVNDGRQGIEEQLDEGGHPAGAEAGAVAAVTGQHIANADAPEPGV